MAVSKYLTISVIKNLLEQPLRTFRSACSLRNDYFYCSQFAQLLPPGMTTQHFCDHVFRTLDLDGNGSLDFREYVLAMDLVEAKTPEDKLKWAFKMFEFF